MSTANTALQFRVGKRYAFRNAPNLQYFEITHIDTSPPQARHAIRGFLVRADGTVESGVARFADGRFCAGVDHDRDLVAEWVAPASAPVAALSIQVGKRYLCSRHDVEYVEVLAYSPRWGAYECRFVVRQAGLNLHGTWTYLDNGKPTPSATQGGLSDPAYELVAEWTPPPGVLWLQNGKAYRCANGHQAVVIGQSPPHHAHSFLVDLYTPIGTLVNTNALYRPTGDRISGEAEWKIVAEWGDSPAAQETESSSVSRPYTPLTCPEHVAVETDMRTSYCSRCDVPMAYITNESGWGWAVDRRRYR